MLHAWLLKLREEAIAKNGEIEWYSKDTPRPPCHPEPVEGCKSCAKRERDTREKTEREQAHADLRTSLLAGLEDVDAFTIKDRPDDDRLRWMLAHLLEYHRREKKPVWWAFYDRCENHDDLIYGDNESIGGLRLCEDVPPFKNKSTERNLIYTYTFPDQQYKLKPGAVYDPVTRNPAGELLTIDPENDRLQIKRCAALHSATTLRAIIPGRPLPTDAQEASLERIARSLCHPLDSHVQANPKLVEGSSLIPDFLLRKPPKLRGHAPGTRIQPDAVTPEALTEIARAMDGTYLFIQGPPGSGKSTKAAHVIAALLRSGKRIGVLANSHTAIHNLLHKVEETAFAHAISFTGLKKSGGEESEFVSKLPSAMIASTAENADFTCREWQLAAGTSWLFAREELAGTLDYLFIDEAGQMALANVIAVAPSAKNVVLLGDPLQLAQVSQGTHPDGIGESALEHLLGEDGTVAPDRGVFLNESYRMHPTICDFISQNVYEGRLTSAPQTKGQLVESRGPLSGAGLRFIPVEHSGNAQESPEEASRLCAEIELLLLSTWIDAKGNTRMLTAEDILVVTPYNAQRRCIQRAFKKHNIAVKVGTVDKFQGQEAAVVFFSMATSSSEEMPRNVEFLFSKNRFNVAISRARSQSGWKRHRS